MTNVMFGLPQILSSFLMIIICCCTDCAAATAIAYEKPEADVLLRRPRNARKDRLVDWKLMFQAYGFLGVVETVCSFTVSYWYVCTVSGESQSGQANQKANGYIGMHNARAFLSRHYGLASATFRRISPKTNIWQS